MLFLYPVSATIKPTSITKETDRQADKECVCVRGQERETLTVVAVKQIDLQ